MKSRALALRAHNLDIAPPDAIAPSSAQSFHAGFLGGKAGRVALKAGGFRLTVTNFALGEDAMQEAVPIPLNRFANAGNFGDVHSGADDHADIVGTAAPGCPELFGPILN